MICEGAGGIQSGFECTGADIDAEIGCGGEEECGLEARGDVRNGGGEGLGDGGIGDGLRGRCGSMGVGSFLRRLVRGD